MSTPTSPLDRRTFIQGAGTLAAASLTAAPSLAAAQESAAGGNETLDRRYFPGDQVCSHVPLLVGCPAE